MKQSIEERLTEIRTSLVTLEGMLQAVCAVAEGYSGNQSAERRIEYLGSSVEIAILYLAAQNDELDRVLLEI